MHQNRFPLGLRPIPHWGDYSAPPDILAVFKGSTSKEREGREKERGEGKEKKRKGEELPYNINGGKGLSHPKILAWCPL